MSFYRFKIEVYIDRQKYIEKGIVLGNSMSDAIKNLEAMYEDSMGNTGITNILKFYETDINEKVIYDTDITETIEAEDQYDMDKHCSK